MIERLKWTEIRSLLKILLIDFIYKEAILFSFFIKTELNFILLISIINFRYAFSYFLQVISMQVMKCNAKWIKNPQQSMTPLTFKGKEVEGRKTEVPATYTCSTEGQRLQGRERPTGRACWVPPVSSESARQAPLSVGFSGRGYWSGWPCPPAGDLPDPGTEPASLVSPALLGISAGTTWEVQPNCRNSTKWNTERGRRETSQERTESVNSESPGHKSFDFRSSYSAPS